MFRPDPRARATWRWGGAIGALLIVQSLLLAALFWWLATQAHVREAEAEFRADCRQLAAMPPEHRIEEIEEAIGRDIHRDRFIALFDRRGRLIDGNVAALPSGAPARGSAILPLAPTRLPGKTADVARLVVCPVGDGERLLTGVDLDDTEHADQVVERALLLGLAPGLILALVFGLIAGRRAARQVDAVRRLAARIAAGDLGERLPVRDPPDSFGLLCAQINAMLDRLQQLVADVRGVGDDIAHQLRTPLTRLRARIERTMRDARTPADFEASTAAALVEIDALLGIVAALLRVRELEDHARRSRFAPVELGQLVEDACDLHRPAAEDRGQELTSVLRPSGRVDGDASLLMEAVSNLIDNAMKFGPTDGRITVLLHEEDGLAIITVADEGGGVPPGERSLVTHRFYRGRQDCEGTGLGLSLVKAIADLHACTLRFAEQGSAVSLVCPTVRE